MWFLGRAQILGCQFFTDMHVMVTLGKERYMPIVSMKDLEWKLGVEMTDELSNEFILSLDEDLVYPIFITMSMDGVEAISLNCACLWDIS